MNELPEVVIETCMFKLDACALCGADNWEPLDPSALTSPAHFDPLDIPCGYTAESCKGDGVPHIVCDACLHSKYPPELRAELKEKRDYFWSH